MNEESLLLTPGVAFRAQREDGGWSVVIGDRYVGYEAKSGLPDWAALERWCWGAIGRLYGS